MKKLLIVAAAVLSMMACKETNPVLTVTGGQIQGVLTDSSEVMVYKGIPYAAAPVGELRWKAPQPVTPWEGVKICDTFGNIAYQPGSGEGTFYYNEFYWKDKTTMSEDCLFLNVYAPAATIADTDAKLPVAMWIHGGAFMNGYGSEITMDGDAWAKRGVILVTINYRLGLLGFLSHPELSAEQGGVSGNYGMMDQVAALKWITENIEQFGGDPDNITVFGQSAGAMSVKNLVASPEAVPMIAKAIIQSGGGYSPRGGAIGSPDSQKRSDETGKDLMDYYGATDLQQMRAIPSDEILGVADKYSQKTGRWVMLSPHQQPDLLPKSFDAAVTDNTVADIPYMIGFNAQDMGGLGGDAVNLFCEMREANGSFPAYQYFFSRNLPGDDDDPETDSGAFHSAELWYTFHTLKNSWRPFTQADYDLSNEMVNAWTSFCKTGNPGWDAYTKANPFIREFDVK